MKNIEKAVKRITSEIIDIERFGWPPDCVGLLYQPERPTLKANLVNEKSEEKEVE